MPEKNSQNSAVEGKEGPVGHGQQPDPNQRPPKETRPESQSPGRVISVLSDGKVELLFNGHKLHAILREGEPWFFAADICDELGIANPRDALTRLDDDERSVATTDTPGGPQEVNVVNESGLYALIFSSRKPVARAFRKWVTQEVLPAIRKTGRYERDQAPPPPQHYVREEIPVTLPGHGRYVVTTRPGHPPHVYRTGYDTVVQDVTDTDCQILAHHLMLIGAYWRKTRQNQSIGLDDRDGFAWNKLEEVILEGGYLGVRCLSLPSREPGKSWREH